MSVRAVTLNATKAGMTRLRIKGGASPETLFDLTNGFVNASKCPQQRPGLTWLFNFANPTLGKAGNVGITKGTVTYKGIVYTFSHTPLTSGSANFVILTLRHPSSTTAKLTAIHFAQPFMGFMYVVAQFEVTSDYPAGFIGHYWLQTPASWKARTQYMDNDMVQPTAPTGYYYQASRVINPPTWTPLLQYKATTGSPPYGDSADRVQPSTYIGSYFIVNQVYGPGSALAPPISRSGSVEPNWTTAGLQNGSFTLEFSTATTPPAPTAGTPAPGQVVPGTGAGGRYTNRSGGFQKP